MSLVAKGSWPEPRELVRALSEGGKPKFCHRVEGGQRALGVRLHRATRLTHARPNLPRSDFSRTRWHVIARTLLRTKQPKARFAGLSGARHFGRVPRPEQDAVGRVPAAPIERVRRRQRHSFCIRRAGSGPLWCCCCTGSLELWYSGGIRSPRLRKREYRVVAPDLRAATGNRWLSWTLPTTTIKTLAADVVGLLDALGEKRCVLVGHDFGPLTHLERTSALCARPCVRSSPSACRTTRAA